MEKTKTQYKNYEVNGWFHSKDGVDLSFKKNVRALNIDDARKRVEDQLKATGSIATDDYSIRELTHVDTATGILSSVGRSIISTTEQMGKGIGNFVVYGGSEPATPKATRTTSTKRKAKAKKTTRKTTRKAPRRNPFDDDDDPFDDDVFEGPVFNDPFDGREFR